MDYNQWYQNVFSPTSVAGIKYGLQNQFDTIGPSASGSPSKPPVINATDIVLDAIQVAPTKPRGERDVTLPDGTTIKGSGNAATDFLNGIFGVSPLAEEGTFETTDGEPVAAGAGGILDTTGFGDWFGRIAIIILGFIFVAVGLSMFKGNVIAIAKDAIKG